MTPPPVGHAILDPRLIETADCRGRLSRPLVEEVLCRSLLTLASLWQRPGKRAIEGKGAGAPDHDGQGNSDG
jgi:hypothetical protein